MKYPEGGKIIDVCLKSRCCLVEYQQGDKIWQEWRIWSN